MGVAEALAVDCPLRDVADAVERAKCRVERLQEVFAQPEDVVDELHVDCSELDRLTAFLLDPAFDIHLEACQARRRDMQEQMGSPMSCALQGPYHGALVGLAAAPLPRRFGPPAVAGPDFIEGLQDGVFVLHALLREIDRHELVERGAELLGEEDGRTAVAGLPPADVIRLSALHPGTTFCQSSANIYY